MTTYQNGGVRSATPNSRKAARRSAANRQCPRCGRKSALKHDHQHGTSSTTCRWDDCGYAVVREHTDIFDPREQDRPG
jgi:ssDNA-binding Zn-finger/Zn-ribbon topoisomerase 1